MKIRIRKITGCVDLLNLQNHKTYMAGFGGGSYVECLTLCILKSSGVFHYELTMSSLLVLKLILSGLQIL